MKRATMTGEKFPYHVFVDGVQVGIGDRSQCIALMDELNESGAKCDAIKKILGC